MKKSEFLEIHFQPLEDLEKKVRKALASRTPNIQPKNQIVFDSVASFRHYMTIQKIELLTAIAIQSPSSIYELAQIVDRDFAAVLRDCTSLEATGFIKLKSAKDAKKTKIPLLSFNYSGIIVYLPRVPYQIEFKVAA